MTLSLRGTPSLAYTVAWRWVGPVHHSNKAGSDARWLCGRWDTRSSCHHTADKCHGRTWRSYSLGDPDTRDTWSKWKADMLNRQLLNNVKQLKARKIPHLLFDILQLLLQFLHICIDISVVFVSLQPWNISTCWKAKQRSLRNISQGHQSIMQVTANPKAFWLIVNLNVFQLFVARL